MIVKKKLIYLLLHLLLLNCNVDASHNHIGARIQPLILGLCPYALDTFTDVLNIKSYYENSPHSTTCSAVEPQMSSNDSISKEASTKQNVGRALVSSFAVISPSWCIIIAYFMSTAKGNKLNIYIILILLFFALLFGPILYPFVVLFGFLSLFITPNEGESMKKGESIGVAASFVEGLTEAPATTVIGLVILIWEGIVEAPVCLPILGVQLGSVTKGNLQVFGTVVSLLMYIKTVGTWHLYCRDKTKTPPFFASLKSSICLLPDVLFRILAMSVMVSILRWYSILVVVPLFLFSWILAIRAGQDISTDNIDHPIMTASISFLCPLVFGNLAREGEDTKNRHIMKYQSQYINAQRKIGFLVMTIGLTVTARLVDWSSCRLMTYKFLFCVTSVFGIITLIQSFCNYPAWLQIKKQEEIQEDHVMPRKKYLDLLKKCIKMFKKENVRAQSMDVNTSSKIFRFRMLLNILVIFLSNGQKVFRVHYTALNLISDSDNERWQTDMYGIVCEILLPSSLLTVAWVVTAANEKKYETNTILFYLISGLFLGPIIYPFGTLAGYIWLFYFPFMRNDLRNQGKLASFTDTFKTLAETIPLIGAYYTSLEMVLRSDSPICRRNQDIETGGGLSGHEYCDMSTMDYLAHVANIIPNSR